MSNGTVMSDSTSIVYFGANTEEKKIGLAWSARTAAMISSACSLFMLWHIMFRAHKRPFDQTASRRSHQEQSGAKWSNMPVRLQLLACTSVSDMISSAALAFGSMPTPSTKDGKESPFWGAQGNEATCKAQGFLIQWGYFCNHCYFLFLSTFYLLTIRYGWTEKRVRQFRPYFVLPALASTGIALAGLGLYTRTPLGCYIPQRPKSSTDIYLLIFNTIPLWTGLGLTSLNLWRVYRHVYRKEKRGNRWRLFQKQHDNRHHHRYLGTSTLTTSTLTTSTSTTQSTGSVPELAAEAPGSNKTSSEPPTRRSPSRLVKAVFWQCLLYLLAYTVPSACLLFGLLGAETLGKKTFSYWLLVPAVFIAFSQGTFQLLVYIRLLLFPTTLKRKTAAPSTPTPKPLEQDRPNDVIDNEGRGEEFDEADVVEAKLHDDEGETQNCADSSESVDLFVDDAAG